MKVTKAAVFEKISSLFDDEDWDVFFQGYHKKTYHFLIGDGNEIPQQSLFIHVAFDKRTLMGEMKSVYDKALFPTRVKFHSDGVMNKKVHVFNSTPIQPFSPNSIQFVYENSHQSFQHALSNLKRDFKNQRSAFYEPSDLMKQVIQEGLNFIDQLSVDAEALAKVLDHDTKEGRFFKHSLNPSYLELLEHMTPHWTFGSTRLLGFGGDNEDKLCYFCLHLLYVYINRHVSKPVQNELYKWL